MLSLIFLIVILVLISLISILIIYYKKLDILLSSSSEKRLSKKQRLRESNFKSLLDEAKKLGENANKDYKDKDYSNSIIKWKKAVEVYLRAMSKSIMLNEQIKIMENIQIIRKNLCGGYFKQSEIQVQKAEELINQNKLDNATKELLFAKESVQNAITIIKNAKFDIDVKIYYHNLDFINSKIENHQ